MKNRSSKRKNFDCTTLVCCAIGVVVSMNSCNFINNKVLNARDAAKRAETVIQVQTTVQSVELEVPDSLEFIQQELLGVKNEIAPIGQQESDDSYNIEESEPYEEFTNENEDSYNAEFEAELLKQSQSTENSSAEKTEEKDDVELEQENSILTSNLNGGGYSESDYELLCEITYAEAGNQTEEQQVAAAATILNRVESNIFPNTIREVIMQKGQFASTRNGHIYACGKTVDFSKVPDMTKEAARKALNGEDPTENWLRKEAKRLGLNSEKYASGGALYFYSPEFTSSSELAARSNIKCKVQKGGHVFYKVWG